MYKLDMKCYKTNSKDEEKGFIIEKCKECKFQIKRIFQGNNVEFYTNMNSHLEHVQIKINLNQDVPKKEKYGIPKYIKLMILPFIRNGVKNAEIIAHCSSSQ